MRCTRCSCQSIQGEEDSYDTVKAIGLCEDCMADSDWKRYNAIVDREEAVICQCAIPRDAEGCQNICQERGLPVQKIEPPTGVRPYIFIA